MQISLSLMLLYTAGCETKWGLVRGRSGFKTKRFGLSTACRFDKSDSGQCCLSCKAVKLICEAFFWSAVYVRIFEPRLSSWRPRSDCSSTRCVRVSKEAPFSAAPSVLSFWGFFFFLLKRGSYNLSAFEVFVVCIFKEAVFL